MTAGRPCIRQLVTFLCLTPPAAGKLSLVRSLVEEYRVPVNPRDRWNNTPTQDAQGNGHPSVVEFLRSQGGLADGVDDVTQQLLSATSAGAIDVVERMLTEGVSPNVRVTLSLSSSFPPSSLPLLLPLSLFILSSFLSCPLNHPSSCACTQVSIPLPRLAQPSFSLVFPPLESSTQFFCSSPPPSPFTLHFYPEFQPSLDLCCSPANALRTMTSGLRCT